MVRTIRRYGGGSRKLYDTRESRYVSLDEIPEWIRRGERVRVVDSRSGADVTAQTLTQVIHEGEKRGLWLLSADWLHDIIRRGQRLLGPSGIRLAPVRDEIALLRHGLAQLERSLDGFGRRPRRRAPRTRRTS